MTPRSHDLLTDLFRAPLDPGYAEAARRRATRDTAPPRWRRAGARGGLLLVLVLAGFLLAVAYRQAARAEPAAARARADLVVDVRERRAETDNLERRADDLRATVVREQDNAMVGGASGADAASLRDLAAASGLGAVTGPGVAVRLADARAPVDPVTGRQTAENPGVVVDRDLQDVANALWQAGAEAVAVNGQRLSATTTIRAAGSAILVDFRPVTSPYTVTAIGGDELEETFTASATAKRFRRYVSSYGMEFGVKRQATVTLSAAAPPRLRFVRPSTEPSAGPVPSGSGGGG
ncbi:MAG TPA: DUF881 domain-containing protein [Micromonosporaceae bacterium]|nr:DUF881 domain-containing protein [Micromonosporaceae bacterium]